MLAQVDARALTAPDGSRSHAGYRRILLAALCKGSYWLGSSGPPGADPRGLGSQRGGELSLEIRSRIGFGIRREYLCWRRVWHGGLLCLPGVFSVFRERWHRQLEQSPNAKLAYEEAKKILTGLADGTVELDRNIVDGARSSLTYKYARASETVMAAVSAVPSVVPRDTCQVVRQRQTAQRWLTIC